MPNVNKLNYHDLYRIRKALTMLVALVVLCLVSDVTEDTPLPGICLDCHEDSPVVSSPYPSSPPCSDNDGSVITCRMLCRFEFSMYRCYIDVYVSGWRRESKLSVCSMKALSVPYRYEYISLDFDTMYKLVTASLFHFVYNTIVF